MVFISEVQVDSLLWEPPRSLLLEAIPTLYRRCKNWKLAFPTANFKLDLNNKFHPLPDYVPESLFGDLGLPEIKIVIPLQRPNMNNVQSKCLFCRQLINLRLEECQEDL